MAYPTFVSTGSAAWGTGAITPGLPSSMQSGDLMLLFVETRNEAVTAASGWVEAPDSPASNASALTTRLTVFYQWYTGGSPSTTVNDSGDHQVAQIMAIRGLAGSGNPFDNTANTAGGNGTSLTFPGETTIRDESLVIVAASTSRDPAGTVTNTFSGWTNADLTSITERIDYASGISEGGGIGVITAQKATAGAFGSTTATQITSTHWTGWVGVVSVASLNADSGGLTLTGGDALFGYLFGDSGSLSLAGGDAILLANTDLQAADGALTVAGGDATFVQGQGFLANAGALTVSGGDVAYHYSIEADAGALTLAGSENEILAGRPEVFQLGFIIDLIPPPLNGSYQRYSERLTVNGTELKVASWSYEEAADGIGERLTIQLADVADRANIASGDQVVFEVGEWDGSQFRWVKLLDSDRLENSQYNVTANAIGPADTFTITASSEIEEKFNKAPGKNIALHIDYNGSAIVVGPPSIETTTGDTIEGEAISYSRLTFHDALNYAFVTGCGFASVSTNIPNFPISNVYFEVGQPYPSAVAGLYGMFNPSLSVVRREDGAHLFIQDETNVIASAMPTPREVNVSRASAIGVANDTSQKNRIGALRLRLNAARFDYTRTDTRVEVSSENVGSLGEYGDTFVAVSRTETYRDFYLDSNPGVPIRSELIEKTEERRFTGVIPMFISDEPGQEDSGFRSNFLMSGSVERFSYTEEGQLRYRYKDDYSRVPIDVTTDIVEEDPENPGQFIKVGEETSLVLTYVKVASEEEFLTYRNHPRKNNSYYLGRREISKSGLIYYDFDNTQLGNAYARAVVPTFQAGNVVDGMVTDWVKLESYLERSIPLPGDELIRVITTTFDYVSGSSTFDTDTQKIGEITRNAAVSEQQEFYLVKGGGNVIDGLVSDFNMGELPFTIAMPLAQRLLDDVDTITENVELTLVGIDTTLLKGMPINARGRDNEDLGNYVIQGRTMSGSPQGYQMRLNARSAKRN